MNPLNPYGDGNVPNSLDPIGITLRKILSVELGGSGGGSGGPPSGIASGDLSGTYPAPTVSRVGNGKMFISGDAFANIGGTFQIDTTTGDVLARDIEVTGEVTSGGGFFGDGSAITALNASNISSGTINAARVPTLNQNTTGSAASFTGSLSGDVTGPQSSTVVGKINGISLSGLDSGILFNTTSTGHPSIATANQIAAGLTGTTGTLNLSGATVTLPVGLVPPGAAIQRIPYTGGVTAAASVASNATHNIIAFLNGTTSSTTLTVTLPAGGFDGQTLDMSFNQSATTVAYAGATTIGALTVSAIGSRQRLIWDLTNTEWR